MMNLETFLLGLALAIDAGVVTFALSLMQVDLPLKSRLGRGFLCAMTFGFFQFFMLWSGSYGGFVISFSQWGYFFPTIVASVFLLISLKFFHESTKTTKDQLVWGFLPLMVLGIVTSIDALASGISFGILPKAYLIAIDIGIITFMICSLFFILSQFFKNIPDKWLLRLAGVIFLGLGSNVIWTHFF